MTAAGFITLFVTLAVITVCIPIIVFFVTKTVTG